MSVARFSDERSSKLRLSALLISPHNSALLGVRNRMLAGDRAGPLEILNILRLQEDILC